MHRLEKVILPNKPNSPGQIWRAVKYLHLSRILQCRFLDLEVQKFSSDPRSSLSAPENGIGGAATTIGSTLRQGDHYLI